MKSKYAMNCPYLLFVSQNLQIWVITQQFGYKMRFAAAYIFEVDG